MANIWQEIALAVDLELHLLFPENPVHESGAPLSEQVATLMQHYNNALPLFRILDVWTNPITGSTIHRVGYKPCAQAAGALLASNDDTLTFYLGCAAIESTFDDQAEMKNLGPHGSNPENNPAGYDEGWAQLKLRYLLGKMISTVDDAMTFARDVQKAVPAFVLRYNNLLTWADRLDISKAHEVYRNRYYLATTGYNFGTTGALKLLGDRNHHADMVSDLEANFAKQLNRPSLMAGVKA